MTALNTAIFVQGKQDPAEIFDVALQQILFYEGRNCGTAAISTHHYTEKDDRETLYISPHENMSVLMAVYYRPGGEMYTKEEASRGDSGCGNPECMSHRAQPAHLIVALASNVHWKDADRAWNAGNLHSGMVWSIGGFLDNKKIPWVWQENISQATHEGYDDLADLVPAVENVSNGITNPLGMSQMISKEIMRRLGFTE